MAAEAASFAEHTDGMAFIERIAERDRGTGSTARAARRLSVLRVSFTFAPLLAAAAVILVLLRPPPTSSTDPLPPARATERFKGKVQLAVIRDRGGDQRRFAADVGVRSGDRVRIEAAVDDARPVVAGFLGKDGSWLVLLAPSLLEAGTYFSERSARFDEAPTEGWILAGDPDAVEEARATKDFSRVTTVAVVIEP